MDTFSLKAGQTKPFEFHGYDADDNDLGIVPGTVSSSDNHTIVVSDKGDGTGTVTAVGSPGGSADVTGDDGKGHTSTLTGTIETVPEVDHVKLIIIEE